jgi:hypothetical protein
LSQFVTPSHSQGMHCNVVHDVVGPRAQVFLPHTSCATAQKPRGQGAQEPYPEQGNATTRYLQDRPGRFILIRWLKNNPDEGPDMVGYFTSVDRPQELVIIKRVRSLPRADMAAEYTNPMTPEIEISTLEDPLVRRQLPSIYPAWARRRSRSSTRCRSTTRGSERGATLTSKPRSFTSTTAEARCTI